MILALHIIFWISVLAIVYSYALYPLFLWLISLLKRPILLKSFTVDDNLPVISILMAAYNEEAVLNEKIQSIFNTSYPLDKIELLVGSDCSTDNTNLILTKAVQAYPNIQIKLFSERQGKVQIINQLYNRAKGSILIVTDANVLLEFKTLFEIAKYFADDRVGLVDTQMKNFGINEHGISFQEKTYISGEVYIKHLESINFGTMIGPFGGCYAVRKSLYQPVPATYLVDDFFVCMSVLLKGKMAVNHLDAVVYEDVSNEITIEFKRKIRIGTGNFQNLRYFRSLLWPPFRAVSFCFFSHKVLRWFGPWFILAAFIANLFLINTSSAYFVLMVAQLFVTILPLADFLTQKFGLHIVLLRFVTHFYTMNLSLLIGFIKSIKGVKTNVWKPTKRLQG